MTSFFPLTFPRLTCVWRLHWHSSRTAGLHCRKGLALPDRLVFQQQLAAPNSRSTMGRRSSIPTCVLLRVSKIHARRRFSSVSFGLKTRGLLGVLLLAKRKRYLADIR